MTNRIVSSLAAAMKSQYGFAVYGAGEPSDHYLARTYQALRQRGATAIDALRKARDMASAGKPGLWPKYGAGKPGAPFGPGVQWVEEPGAIGLRFVGFADHIARINHKGWFTDEDQMGGTLRGAVYQLPARNGRPRFMAGYQNSEDGTDGAALALREVFIGEDSEDEDAKRDAAYRADRLAEIVAESERDYQAAWHEGSKAASAIATAESAREEAKRVLRDVRAIAATGYDDSLARSLRDRLRPIAQAKLCEARAAYEKAADLWREHGHNVRQYAAMSEAFREGAGAASYWEARGHANA